jgi:hypothetical protein
LRWLRRGRHVGTLAADERAAAAEAEVELSRQRLRETSETVVKPLRAYAEHNQFADLIAQSLTQGRRRRGPG